MLWLTIFFLVPMGFLGYQSLESGSFPHFHFSWEFSNFSSALSGYHTQLIRSFVYAGIATVACSVLAYPLVYWIAFRSGPWRNLFLLIIVAPFFVTYLVRTLAWLNILADEGRSSASCATSMCSRPTGGFWRRRSRSSRDHLQLLPFMALPLYVSLEQIDARLLEAAKDLYASPTQAFLRVTLPLSRPECRGDAPHLHPGGRRLHQRRAARHAEADDDRERHPGEVPGVARLPDRGLALVHPHGDDPRRAARLRRVVGPEKLTG
jgi:spermidine/putrescine transport system permease protein